MNIIIKYDFDGSLKEGEIYDIKFNWDKCISAFYYRDKSIVMPLDESYPENYPNGEFPIDWVKKFDGEYIKMKFSGIVDGSQVKIFILDIVEIERDRKLKLLDI